MKYNNSMETWYFFPHFADGETKQACREAKQIVQVDQVVIKRIKSVFFNIVHILS